MVPSSLDARFGGIAKWEMRHGGGGLNSVVRFGPNRWGGEPIVVPKHRAGDGASDAVYLVTFVHDELLEQSFVSVVDGETMQQVAVLRIPSRVPFGLHGHWVDSADM